MAVIRKSIAKYMELRTAEQVDEIIVHCSATREGRPFGVEDIERWHRERGFAMCGYHFVIALDGEVQPARPAGYVGAHCEGHNKRSIGVCYIGGAGPQDGGAEGYAHGEATGVDGDVTQTSVPPIPHKANIGS